MPNSGGGCRGLRERAGRCNAGYRGSERDGQSGFPPRWARARAIMSARRADWRPNANPRGVARDAFPDALARPSSRSSPHLESEKENLAATTTAVARRLARIISRVPFRLFSSRAEQCRVWSPCSFSLALFRSLSLYVPARGCLAASTPINTPPLPPSPCLTVATIERNLTFVFLPSLPRRRLCTLHPLLSLLFAQSLSDGGLRERQRPKKGD